MAKLSFTLKLGLVFSLKISSSDMQLTADNKLKKLIVVGDRVLIRLKKPHEKTDSGLYLPPGVQEKEKVQQGYIIKAGPGYPIPMPVEDHEPWMDSEEKVKYVPLQAKEGDLAIFLLSGAHEVIYEGEKYYIVSQGAILMLEREQDL
jgi:chaperonin GroES